MAMIKLLFAAETFNDQDDAQGLPASILEAQSYQASQASNPVAAVVTTARI